MQNGHSEVDQKAAAIETMGVPRKKTPGDFIFGKCLGEGSLGTVYLGFDVNSKCEYAIKVYEKQQILREFKQKYVHCEREAMRIMSNTPGFVKLACTFQDNRSLYFVMTYAKKGDLLTHINRVGAVDVNCTRHYIAELVLSCEQLRRSNVIHRDLKPENILLDDDMHTLITDFGSAKILTTANHAESPPHNNNDDSQDEWDSPIQYRYRRGSFVGTAQYMSPEMLSNCAITPASDLWSLGCIIYQMISGLPPFRGSNDFMIYHQILDAKPEYPADFDEHAKDLVSKLLNRRPLERLGAQDEEGYYKSIRAHSFFLGIDFDTVREQKPPTITPYMPCSSREEKHCCERSFHLTFDNLQIGLDNKLSLGSEKQTFGNNEQLVENIFDLTPEEMQKLLDEQKNEKWHVFADNKVILKKGYVNKRKGLFAHKHMLLLTTGPRLIYIDAIQMIKKGEIPWSAELHADLKNLNFFFVDTPRRIYCLEDLEGHAHTWVQAINRMSERTYGKREEKPASNTGYSGASAQTTISEASPPAVEASPKTASISTSVGSTPRD